MDILTSRGSVSRFVGVAIGLMGLALGPVDGALGQTSQRWIGPSGGWWDSYVNWFPGNEPTGSTYTQFLQTGTYAINFRGNGTANTVQAQFGDVTFNLAGYTLNIQGTGASDPGLQVGAEPSDNARLTIRQGTVSAINAGIADNGYSFGNRPSGYLGVVGLGARLEVSGDFGVGHTGPGMLDVRNGGVVTSTQFGMVAGWIPGSNGVVRVADAGSTLMARDMYIGQEGRGRVLVDAGGTLTSTRGVIFALTGTADGLITVRGAGSRWTHTREQANSQVSIGTAGPGALAVLAGGLFTSDETVRVKPLGRVHGDGTVAGNVINDGLVSPGGSYNDATNELTAAGIATLTVQGTFSQSSTGVLAIDVGAVGAGQHDLLAVSGVAGVAGTLRLTSVNGYAPSVGDSFVVLTASTVGGSFSTVSGPALPVGLSYLLTYSSTQIVVTIGPTPPVCPADLGRQGGLVGSDGHYDNNDFVVFISLYFAGDVRADLGRQGGAAGSDGILNNNDFVVFIDDFFVGCH